MSTNSLKSFESLREIFSNSIAFTVINKYGKGGVVQISTVFGPPYMLRQDKSSERGLLRGFFSHVSESIVWEINQL